MTIFLLNLFLSMASLFNISQNFYDIKIKSLQGDEINLNQYKGKKILIVNVASECGYTPQYAQLQELYETHRDQLVIIGVPCNDFGGQEPGEASEIQTFCTKNYGVTFPITEKIGIKTNTHPLYQWLTSEELNGKGDFEVKWNFHKFLVNESGILIGAYPSSTSPLDDAILNQL